MKSMLQLVSCRRLTGILCSISISIVKEVLGGSINDVDFYLVFTCAVPMQYYYFIMYVCIQVWILQNNIINTCVILYIIEKMNKKFEVKTARVKGVCFHPSKPWIITSLHTGSVMIWDFNMNILIAKFDEHNCPVRGVDFHPHMPLFVTGSDDGDVRVWNYKQKRCTFVLKGHIDYIRTTYFHHELPWILSASDDQTMRIWNYQNRNCVNIITGHCHYVMCAQFHPQKNFIVSASLDSTIRIWDFSILRKKLTETKNASSFIGIEIQCIKILEGHERGANWVCFHPSQNFIASSSDDRKIKLWKYTHEVAWEHSTILGHKSNISCVLFDKNTGNLISNSEDKTTRVWNIDTKNQIVSEKREKGRYWILATNKNGSLIASGHDQGLDIYQLHQEVIPYAVLDENLIIFAQGMKTFLYETSTKKQKMELYQFKPANDDALCIIDRIITNPFEQKAFMVQINVDGQRSYQIKKKQQYLTYPTVSKAYSGLDSCFISADKFAILLGPRQLQISNFKISTQKTQVITLKQPYSIKSIFSSNIPNQLFVVTSHNSRISKFNFQTSKFTHKQQLQDIDVQQLYFGYNKLAIRCMNQIVITSLNLQLITVIKQTYPIKSVFWERDNLIFYTTINHLKYALMNGQTGVVKTIQQPLHLIKKLPNNKFLVFQEKEKVMEILFPDYTEIQFKIAINQKNWDEVNKILEAVGNSQQKILIKYLVEKGHAELALKIVKDTDEKFALAIQASNFELAFQLCNKKNTVDAWKMLGEEAMKQGIFQAYELSCQKLKNFDELNFLYSLQGNTQKLQKMLKISKKMKNPVLGFNTSIFLNSSENYEQVLGDSGLKALAELAAEARKNPQDQCELLQRLGSAPLEVCKPVGDDNYSNWPHVMDDDEEDEDDDQN